jgi:hypothetical protein
MKDELGINRSGGRSWIWNDSMMISDSWSSGRDRSRRRSYIWSRSGICSRGWSVSRSKSKSGSVSMNRIWSIGGHRSNP